MAASLVKDLTPCKHWEIFFLDIIAKLWYTKGQVRSQVIPLYPVQHRIQLIALELPPR